MWYFFIFINVFGLLEAQNFRYVPEDWYIITKPGAITAIAEDNFNLYFTTENGVYRYDKAREDFQYDYTFSVQLEFPKITHFYFDSYRDYFWMVHGQGISFKSSVSTIWRDMSLMNSGLFSINEIDDIGASPEYFWIRSGDDVFPFDPFSATPENWDEAMDEIDFINWGHSSSGIAGENLDLFWYSMEGDWEISLGHILPNGKRDHVISNKNGIEVTVTMQMEDSIGNLWIGTNEGYVVKGWTNSSRLTMISIGLLTDNILEPLALAKILAKIYEEEKPGLVVMGKQAIDRDNNQTGQMFAALTNLSQGTFASKIDIEGEQAIVTREVDGGLQTIKISIVH